MSRPFEPQTKSRRELKRTVGLGLALIAAGVMALLYLRTL